MQFLYPLLTFLQPGILWSALAEYRIMQIASLFAFVAAFARPALYPRTKPFKNLVFVWLCCFLFVQVISVYYGGLDAVLDEFWFWLPFFMFMVISVLLIRDDVALKRYISGMSWGCLFVVCYGIYMAIFEGGYSEGTYENTGRAGAYGMYLNHNDYTFIVIQILPFLFTLRRIETGFFRRLIFLLGMLACVLGVFLSLSRGGILALVLEFTLILFIAMKGKRRFLWLPVLAVVAIVAIAYLWKARAENQPGDYDAKAAESSRFEFWESGLLMLEKHPLLGVGSRRFSEYSAFYGEITSFRIGRNSHNTYIEILAGSGVLGFVPFMLFAYMLIKEMHRRPPKQAPPLLEAVRTATLISFYSLLFRAFLDAKMYDWSFYTLCALAVTYSVLRQHYSSLPDNATKNKLIDIYDALPMHNKLKDAKATRMKC